MRRIFRRLLTALSSVLCILCITFWIRSYWYIDEFGLGTNKNRTELTVTFRTAYTERGSVLLMAEHLLFHDPDRIPETFRSYFGYSNWETNFAVNHSFRTGEKYIAPISPAIEHRISTFVGFGFKRQPSFFMSKGALEKSVTFVLFPFWLPVLVTMIGPILHLRSYTQARRRRTANLCPTCAYDLRMHHPGDKCPECGTPIASHSSRTP